MSSWQYRTHLLPSFGVQNCHGKVPYHIDVDRWRDSDTDVEAMRRLALAPDYWSDVHSSRVKCLHEIVNPRRSWSSDALMFGEEGGNNIEIWFADSDQIKRVSVDFHLAELDLGFIRKVVLCAATIPCLFHGLEDGAVFAPSFEMLIPHMKMSKASRYLDRPEILDGLIRKT